MLQISKKLHKSIHKSAARNVRNFQKINNLLSMKKKNNHKEIIWEKTPNVDQYEHLMNILFLHIFHHNRMISTEKEVTI